MRKVVDVTVEPRYFTLFFLILKELVDKFSYQELLFNVVSNHINDTYFNFFNGYGIEFYYSRDFLDTSDDNRIVHLVFEFLSLKDGYREIYKVKSSKDYVEIYGGLYV